MAYRIRIDDAAKQNEDFRRVLFTTPRTQLVLMTVQPGDDIGLETHDLDQVLCFVSGRGESVLAGERAPIGPGDVVVVPAGTEHNFINIGSEPLRLFTVYAPPEHADGTVHVTKAEADEAEAREHGREPPSDTGRSFTVGSLRSRGN